MSAPRRITLDDGIEFVRALVRDNWPGDAPEELTLRLRSGKVVCLPFSAAAPSGKDWELLPEAKLLRWHGREYPITTGQVGPLGLLLSAYEDNSRDVSVAALVEAAESKADRPSVRDVFKRSPLLEDGILSAGTSKGTWRLLRPDEVQQ